MKKHMLVLALAAVFVLTAYASEEVKKESQPVQPVTATSGMVLIPGGTFEMGCVPGDKKCEGDEKPRHRVTLKSFYMDAHEVTQAEYRKAMGTNPSYFKNCGDDCPVERVSWNDAKAYCEKAGKRLPTEAEWEYAARGGTETTIYTGGLTIRGQNNGPELDAIAWYGGNSGVSYAGGYDCSGWPEKQYSSSSCGTHPVGQKRPNAYGLYDMLGNVWEWTADWYDKGYYASSPENNPQGPSSGTYRVLRGGGWFGDARGARTSRRYYLAPGGRNFGMGFRCVRE